MTSLHLTLTRLLDAFVHDVLRALRTATVNEVVDASFPQPRLVSKPRAAPAGSSAAPLRSPRRAAARARATPRKPPLEGRPAVHAPVSERKGAGRGLPKGGEIESSDELAHGQITDPEALLREAATPARAPTPAPSAASAAGTPAAGPALRAGEEILRTPSGSTVLRRRRAE